MQPTPLRIIGACTYRRFLPLRRPTLARAQRSAACLALRRTLHFRVIVVASSNEAVLGLFEEFWRRGAGALRCWGWPSQPRRSSRELVLRRRDSQLWS